MMRLPLAPDPGIQFEHAYIPSRKALGIGSTVLHHGKPWQVTWCQPQKLRGFWLVMIIPSRKTAIMG